MKKLLIRGLVVRELGVEKYVGMLGKSLKGEGIIEWAEGIIVVQGVHDSNISMHRGVDC